MSAVATITALMAEEEATRTLLDLLTTEKMDGSDSATPTTATATVTTTGNPLTSSITRTGPSSSNGLQGRWGALKQRLGLKGIICCGGGWAHHHNRLPDDVEDEYDDAADVQPHSPRPTPASDDQERAVNLATALAEERQFRQLATSTAAPMLEESSVPGTPATKVSLMRLMAEAAMEAGEEEGGRSEGRCCVCMEREKGAAFIPCGHTFCRVCSREVWLNRGSCPLCNRPILDVLDIF